MTPLSRAERPRLLDVNVLLALTYPLHVHHRDAHLWFAQIDNWATTPMTEAGLVRLLLNRAIMGGDYSAATGVDLLRRLRALDGHVFLPDDSSLADSTVSLQALVGHRQVTDLHLANLAARHGFRLATFDRRLLDALPKDDQDSVEIVPIAP